MGKEQQLTTEKKKKGFELAKPMNMVQMNWPKGMTPMQIKAIHVVTMKLKKWILDTNFQPDPTAPNRIDAYQGIKTSFEMSLAEFANLMQTTPRALKTPVKDKDGQTVMLKNFPKLRIQEYFEEVQNVSCPINSPYLTGSLEPLPAAIFDKENETVRLGTTLEMAVILQDEAFTKNLSYVDMQLQISLNSVMASHILDRISRFKEYPRDYQCTVGDLIDQCGIDDAAIKNRNNFINNNLKRPLKQIEDKSNGIWERIGTGVTVTTKKRGTLLREDEITFKMKYNTPKIDNLFETKTTKQLLQELAETDASNINALIASATLKAIVAKTATEDQIKGFLDSLKELKLPPDAEIERLIAECLTADDDA